MTLRNQAGLQTMLALRIQKGLVLREKVSYGLATLAGLGGGLALLAYFLQLGLSIILFGFVLAGISLLVTLWNFSKAKKDYQRFLEVDTESQRLWSLVEAKEEGKSAY